MNVFSIYKCKLTRSYSRPSFVSFLVICKFLL